MTVLGVDASGRGDLVLVIVVVECGLICVDVAVVDDKLEFVGEPWLGAGLGAVARRCISTHMEGVVSGGRRFVLWRCKSRRPLDGAKGAVYGRLLFVTRKSAPDFPQKDPSHRTASGIRHPCITNPLSLSASTSFLCSTLRALFVCR